MMVIIPRAWSADPVWWVTLPLVVVVVAIALVVAMALVVVVAIALVVAMALEVTGRGGASRRG